MTVTDAYLYAYNLKSITVTDSTKTNNTGEKLTEGRRA